MDILFWSGGKDAFLALEFHRQNFSHRTVSLLTTYNQETNIVPHQEISIEHINKQAVHLNLDILTVPLPEECSNEVYLQEVNRALSQKTNTIEHLVFGDWHLQDIRRWREDNFKTSGYRCCFPIWEKDLNELLSVLFLKPVKVKISAVQEKFKSIIKVGETYNQDFVKQLPDEIDPMGERGEFHTEVRFEH